MNFPDGAATNKNTRNKKIHANNSSTLFDISRRTPDINMSKMQTIFNKIERQVEYQLENLITKLTIRITSIQCRDQ